MSANPDARSNDLTTVQAARQLGLAVRSVQLMVDRGELHGWKTPGGHRRIARDSVERWKLQASPAGQPASASPVATAAVRPRRVLLIDDSVHYQTLIKMVLQRRMPEVELRVAPEPLSGLVMLGAWQPDVLLIDILLPGMNGAAIVAGLRAQRALGSSRVVVITSLGELQREAYAADLRGFRVVCKSALPLSLPPALQAALDDAPTPESGLPARSDEGLG